MSLIGLPSLTSEYNIINVFLWRRDRSHWNKKEIKRKPPTLRLVIIARGGKCLSSTSTQHFGALVVIRHPSARTVCQ